MGFMDMVAKAKAGFAKDGDFFMPGVKGVMDVERIFQHNGEQGMSVILTGTVISCEPKVSGGQSHSVGVTVKKIYALSKFPLIAPNQLKRDILSIDGLNEADLSTAQMSQVLSEIFENTKSPLFELRGYRTEFDTRVIERKDKVTGAAKSPITGVNFKHMKNEPKEVEARAKAISARLGK